MSCCLAYLSKLKEDADDLSTVERIVLPGKYNFLVSILVNFHEARVCYRVLYFLSSWRLLTVVRLRKFHHNVHFVAGHVATFAAESRFPAAPNDEGHRHCSVLLLGT